MFRQDEGEFAWAGGGAAVLSPRLRSDFGRAPVSFAPTIARAGQRCSTTLPDLGADIGSASWWRGVALLVALCMAAIAPGFMLDRLPSLPAATPPADALKQREAQAFAPLSRGATTGRRMIATDAVRPLLDTPERPRLVLAATLAAGDTLAATLLRVGVDGSQASRAVALIASVTDVAAIAPGTVLNITLGQRSSRGTARPLERLDLRARFDLSVAVASGANGHSLETRPIAVERASLRITGRVNEGLYLAARAAGAPPHVVEAYIRALAAKLSLSSLAPDDRFDFVVERARAATGEVRYGRLAYVGLEQAAANTRMIEWAVDGHTGWHDEADVSERRGGFVEPIVGGRQTSGFGWRWHPILGYGRMHQGIDYGVTYGTPIRAVSDGIVTVAGWHGGHGNMIKLVHAGGLGSGYAHMSGLAVRAGAHVAAGQVIGYVGSTGLSTGPHLHFEVYRGGVPVNPASVSFASGALLSGPELAAFKARLASFSGTLLRSSSSR